VLIVDSRVLLLFGPGEQVPRPIPLVVVLDAPRFWFDSSEYSVPARRETNYLRGLLER